MSFKDKVVIVTGASSGIGAAAAIMFTQEGAKLTIVARNLEKLMNVAKSCADSNSVNVIKGDVANDDDARRIIDSTIKKFGKLDILVNNAGVVRYGTLMQGDILKSFDDIIGINLRAVVHLSMLAAPHLVQSKGNIVNISSVAGQMHVTPAVVAYCTSKAGVDHFTRGCSLELAPLGVRVNAVSPGPVATDLLENSGDIANPDLTVQTPLGRTSESSEIADLILFLASDKARGITGSIFVTDNGCLVKL